MQLSQKRKPKITELVAEPASLILIGMRFAGPDLLRRSTEMPAIALGLICLVDRAGFSFLMARGAASVAHRWYGYGSSVRTGTRRSPAAVGTITIAAGS